MSTQMRCDNCEARYDPLGEDAHRWRVVGFNGNPQDACSDACARAILDECQRIEWEVEEMTDDQLAES